MTTSTTSSVQNQTHTPTTQQKQHVPTAQDSVIELD
jgi:hypothetical protein